MQRLGERFRELDIPLLVEWSDGRREAILFVVEEETEASRFSIHRLVHYCLDVAELIATDRVVPVVIFVRGGPRRASLRLGGDRHTYLDFRYLACDLSRLPATEHLASANIVVRLNLPNMAYPSAARLDIYAAAQQGLASLEADPERQRKYADFIDYYAQLSDEEIARYRERYLAEEGEMMGLAQILRDEGRQEGVQQGIRQGIQQGEQALLERQLTRRFGPLPSWAQERLARATTAQLEQWADRVLEADSLERVLGPRD